MSKTPAYECFMANSVWGSVPQRDSASPSHSASRPPVQRQRSNNLVRQQSIHPPDQAKPTQHGRQASGPGNLLSMFLDNAQTPHSPDSPHFPASLPPALVPVKAIDGHKSTSGNTQHSTTVSKASYHFQAEGHAGFVNHLSHGPEIATESHLLEFATDDTVAIEANEELKKELRRTKTLAKALKEELCKLREQFRVLEVDASEAQLLRQENKILQQQVSIFATEFAKDTEVSLQILEARELVHQNVLKKVRADHTKEFKKTEEKLEKARTMLGSLYQFLLE